jgi:hypothetical protein
MRTFLPLNQSITFGAQIAPTEANVVHGDASSVKIELLNVHASDLHTTPLHAHTMNGEASGATNVLLPGNSMDFHVSCEQTIPLEPNTMDGHASGKQNTTLQTKQASGVEYLSLEVSVKG